MKATVSWCWGGNKNYWVNLDVGSHRYSIPIEEGEKWTRNLAGRCLDLLAVELPHIKRKNWRWN